MARSKRAAGSGKSRRVKARPKDAAGLYERIEETAEVIHRIGAATCATALEAALDAFSSPPGVAARDAAASAQELTEQTEILVREVSRFLDNGRAA